jgi:hypothetical protein
MNAQIVFVRYASQAKENDMLIRIIDQDKIPKNRRYDFNDNFEDIKEEFLVDESKVEICQPFKKNGVVYSPCLISLKDKYAVCKKVIFPDDVDCDFTGDIVCPSCGNAMNDSWEMHDSGEDICQVCGASYSYERIVTVDYSTELIKKGEIIEA